MEFEPAMDVLLDPLVPCAVARINVPLSASDVAQNMSDDQLNHMERVDYMDGIGKVAGYIFFKRTVHVCDEIFHFSTLLKRYAVKVWFSRLLLPVCNEVDGVAGDEVLNDKSIITISGYFQVNLIYADRFSKRQTIHVHIPGKCVYCICVRNIASSCNFCSRESGGAEVFNDHEVCHIRIMFVALYKTELFGLEMATDRVGAFPATLFEKYGDLASVLKDRMIKSPGIWSSGIHTVAADRTVFRLAGLTYHNFY